MFGLAKMMRDGRTLPGTQTPYLLRCGEGERYLVGSQLATVIARPQDTRGLLECVIWSGGKGAAMPAHVHARGHEALLVLDGELEVIAGEVRASLTRGDYASIPPRTRHSYRMLAHGTKLAIWTINGAAYQFCQSFGTPFEGMAYPPDASNEIETKDKADTSFAASDTTPDLPVHVVEAGEGERLLAGDQLFTFLAHQGQTHGAFIALMTAGPTGTPIPKHFHEKHTETFLCLDGRMTMWANDDELELAPGDFLHVPAGTIHAYRLDSPYTRFAGVLSPGLFEPFFRAMCEPYEGHTFPVVPGPVRFDRVMRQLHELDLKLVGPPPGPPPGATRPPSS
jgi:quercetin 2,3-dioxygenase